jgi:hypothetical protein
MFDLQASARKDLLPLREIANSSREINRQQLFMKW